MKTKYDGIELYCKKLGHHLTFKYCREENFGIPCAKIRDCWFKNIDIENYLSQNFSPGETTHLYKQPMPKISSLLELIERAKQNT